MKKLFTKQTIAFVLCFLICTSFTQLFAQASGDYRSNVTTGNWNATGSWQTYNGSTWGTASSAPGSSNSVYIQSGHTITLTQNESCNDLHIATGTTGISATLLGKIALSTFALSVNGKLRCYTGTVGTIPGTSSTLGYSIYPFTIGTGGKISIVGTTRNITNTGEWSGAITTASTGAFPLEINMNTTSDTAKPQTSIKASSFVIARGVLNASTNRMAPDNATPGQGDFTVNSGGTFRSAQSGTSSGSQVISRTGSSRAGVFTINAGGRMILSGTTPCIDMNSVSISGTVEFSGGNLTTAQSFARKSGLDASAVDIPTYNDVILNTNVTSLPKTLTVNTTINGKLTLQDSGRFALSTFALTYSGSASLEYLSTSIGQTTSSAEWPNSGSQPSIVSINNSANVTLGASTSIASAGRLALVSGKLVLGTNSLTMSGTTSAFSTSASSASPLSFGASYSSYIVTNSTGVLTIASIGTGGRTGDVLFPIGVSTSIYNPAVLNASSAASSFSLSTISGSIPKVSAAQSLNNYWIVSGTGTATVKGQWNASDEGGSFDRTNARMVSFNSGLISATSATSSGTAPYTYSGSSYSSFNNFGMMSGLANEPTQVSSLSFSNLQSTSFDVSWNNGNGTNRIVLVKSGAAVNANPADGSSYTADPVFGNGSQIGSGNYVVYNGTGNTASISGLTNGTTYYVAVYEFNGVDGIVNYNTTSPATGDPYSPSIVVSSSSLSAFSNTALGSSSNNQTFTVSGNYLDDDITLSAPSGFEISTSNNSGFGNSVVLTRNSGSVSTTTIYARFTPTTTGSTSGSITIASLNATTQNVAVSGNGIAAEPTTQTSAISFTNVAATAMTINWTNGDGANRLVVVKQGSAVTGTPVDATSYTPNTAFGSGSTIATGEFVVFGCCSGGNSVTVTGLNPNTTYHIAIFEFNGSGGAENYIITSPATGNQLTNNTSYRSVATGNWSSASSWEISSDGSTWSAASSAPTFTDGPITIRSGHNITSNAAVTVDQVTVALGGTLTISSGMTINNGSGTDISCDGIIVGSTGTPFTINSGAAIQINSGGKYQHNSNTGGIPTCTWSSGSTCEVVGFTSGTPTSATLNQSFHHFTWNCTQSAAIGLSAGLTTVNGNFTVTNTNGQQLRLTGTNSGTLSIGGNLVIGNGTNTAILAPSSSSGVMTINVAGDIIINNNGQLNETSGTSGGKFTMTVSGNLDCSGGGTILTTSTSSNTLTLAGSSLTTKSINMGSGSHNFNKCDLSIGNGSTSCVYQVVGNNLVFNTSNSSARTFVIASLATLDLNGFTLSLDNSGSTTGSITGAGSLTANATGSTVNYASSG
ncbi:MAG: hypothetical protein NTZ59_02505, partial [Bacteroidetes bacterium]|nr:hypothetical protein [Bacteroidota bacterium]